MRVLDCTCLVVVVGGVDGLSRWHSDSLCFCFTAVDTLRSGNAFLSHIAAVDGIYHLVRAFDSDEVIHVDDSVDPIRDLETIQGELCAKDKETLEKTVDRERERVRKEKGLARAADVPLSETFLSAHEKCTKLIESNTPVQTHEDFSAAEVDMIRDWGLSECIERCKCAVRRRGSNSPPRLPSFSYDQTANLCCQPFEKEFHSQGFEMVAQDCRMGQISRWWTMHSC